MEFDAPLRAAIAFQHKNAPAVELVFTFAREIFRAGEPTSGRWNSKEMTVSYRRRCTE
jgi:hypothetical protein